MVSKIAIDNGHGYDTKGKRTPPFPNSGKVIREWEFNHPTARKLKGILESYGHQVLMVSDTSEDTPINQRVKKANDWGADIFVSIHYNASKGVWGDWGGVETLYFESSERGKVLAQYVQKELSVATQLRDRGIKPRPSTGESRVGVLVDTKMPAVLAECGFMDNLVEAELMLNVTYQQKCAEAVASGINKYLGIQSQSAKQEGILIDFRGKLVTVKGFTNNGVTYLDVNGLYVPLRSLFESWGFDVIWNNMTKITEIR